MAGIGRDETERLIDLLLRLKGQLTMVLVEHDMAAVFALADRISVQIRGRLLTTGSPADVRADPQVVAAYLGEQWSDGGRADGENLQAAYGAARVLFDVSFRVGEGEMVTLLGRNGMGKTTTISTIMGLLRRRRPHHLRRRAPRWPAAVPRRAGRSGSRARRPADFSDAQGRGKSDCHSGCALWAAALEARRYLPIVPGLAERRRNMGNELSGGEQQMLAIGRSLMTNPQLLILDEATEGLAPLIRNEIWASLKRLKAEGQAILLVDKHIDALMKLADRHVVIEKGLTVWSGSSAELAADPTVRQRYLQV